MSIPARTAATTCRSQRATDSLLPKPPLMVGEKAHGLEPSIHFSILLRTGRFLPTHGRSWVFLFRWTGYKEADPLVVGAFPSDFVVVVENTHQDADQTAAAPTYDQELLLSVFDQVGLGPEQVSHHPTRITCAFTAVHCRFPARSPLVTAFRCPIAQTDECLKLLAAGPGAGSGGGPRPAAAIPTENPYCRCKLTRVPSVALAPKGGAAREGRLLITRRQECRARWRRRATSPAAWSTCGTR